MVLAHWPVNAFAASACCCIGMVTNVIATTPNIPSAATMAKIASDELFMLALYELSYTFYAFTLVFT